MTRGFTDIAFTPAVRETQTRFGSRDFCQRLAERGGRPTTITADLADFIAARDSAYFGTASADGQPYIQHRGGPPGFIHVLDAHDLAFADYPGNKQYITAGNLSENDRAFMFLIDYPSRRRIKLWGRARVVDDDPALLGRLHAPVPPRPPERAIRFTVAAWDVNCRQYITPRHDEAAIEKLVQDLKARIVELEAELDRRPAIV